METSIPLPPILILPNNDKASIPGSRYTRDLNNNRPRVKHHHHYHHQLSTSSRRRLLLVVVMVVVVAVFGCGGQLLYMLVCVLFA